MVLAYNSDKSFILASASPRRKVLLSQIIDNYDIITADVDESIEEGTEPINAAMLLAAKKGRYVAESHRDNVVIAADTIVVCDNEILGKPQNEKDAARMLNMLSNRAHTVITGVFIGYNFGETVFAQCSTVYFKRLSDCRIKRYIKTGEPMDKAGSYAIQGKAGHFVRKISGDRNNIIGLPVKLLTEKLLSLGLINED